LVVAGGVGIGGNLNIYGNVGNLNIYGNVGINKSNPLYPLDISGIVNVQNTSGILAINSYSQGSYTNNIIISNDPLLKYTGGQNTCIGYQSLKLSINSNNNTAVGYNSLSNSIEATYNTAVGSFALRTSSNSYNTAVGHNALLVSSGIQNTALGHNAFTESSTGTLYAQSTAIGYDANPTRSNQVVLGTPAEQVYIPGSESSTSFNTGALVVAGGVGIGGNVNINGRINSTTNIVGSVSLLLTNNLLSTANLRFFLNINDVSGPNGLSNGGDTGIIFGRKDATTPPYNGNLVIGPFISRALGIKMTQYGNVGINTPNPLYTLDVSGTARINSNLIVDKSIGVNTSNPLYPLDVSGTARINLISMNSFSFNSGSNLNSNTKIQTGTYISGAVIAGTAFTSVDISFNSSFTTIPTITVSGNTTALNNGHRCIHTVGTFTNSGFSCYIYNTGSVATTTAIGGTYIAIGGSL
jgi:hypothetical protein